MVHGKQQQHLEQLGDKKAALRCYKKMLSNLRDNQGEEFLQVDYFLN